MKYDKSIDNIKEIFHFLNLSDRNINKIIQAANCCQLFHAFQNRRKDGTPYASHPTYVAETIIVDLLKNDDTLHLTEDEITTLICSAYLHDVLEDNQFISYEYLGKIFGVQVANTVFNVSKTRNSDETTDSYFKKVFSDKLSGIIKLADRLHNLQTLNSFSNPRRKIKETIDFIVPFMYSCNPYLSNKIYEQLDINLSDHFIDGFCGLDEQNLYI